MIGLMLVNWLKIQRPLSLYTSYELALDLQKMYLYAHLEKIKRSGEGLVQFQLFSFDCNERSKQVNRRIHVQDFLSLAGWFRDKTVVTFSSSFFSSLGLVVYDLCLKIFKHCFLLPSH